MGTEDASLADDHRMWACVGIYSGRELNELYRRPAHGAGLVRSGEKRLDEGDVLLLGADTVHAVTNPVDAPTGAIHVYGGDFVAQPRNQWLEPDLVEEPYDLDLVTQEFAAANAAWRAR